MGTSIYSFASIERDREIQDDCTNSILSKLDDFFRDETNLFENKLRVLKSNTTNECVGITPGNLTNCGGKSCPDNIGTIGFVVVFPKHKDSHYASCLSNHENISSDSCNGGEKDRC